MTSARVAAAPFFERLLPGPGGWSAVLAFAAALGLAVWPVSTVAAVVVGSVIAIVGVAALWAGSPVVTVKDGSLRAGRARIPVTFLGTTTPLDRAGMHDQLGPGLDARAYVCLRTWARTGIRVELTDPQDPTPYWLVSTRRPTDLVAALDAAR